MPTLSSASSACGTAGWEAPTEADAEVPAMGLLYRAFRDPQCGADLALVRAMRQLTAQYLQANAQDDEANGGISFETICIAEGHGGVADFCAQVVLPLGVEAESIVLSALPRSAGVSLRVALVDRSESTELYFDDHVALAEAGEVPVVHVQLRPGHYDLLYFGAPPVAATTTLLPQAADTYRRGTPTFAVDGADAEWVVQDPPVVPELGSDEDEELAPRARGRMGCW